MVKYIVIVGGSFGNKGSESMIYTVVNQFKKRHPDHEIVLFDCYPGCRKKSDDIYAFRIVNFDIFNLFLLTKSVGILFSIKQLIKNKIKIILNMEKKKETNLSLVNDILSKTKLIVDITGYGLSSHNQGIYNSLYWLMNIKMAYLHKIPFVVLPQTLGPFDFPFLHKKIISPLIKKYLFYPKYIFTRELKGLEDVRKIRQANVYREYDIVLQSNDNNLENIFEKHKAPKPKNIKINNSVCIIPNARLQDLVSKAKIIRMYDSIINHLITKGENVVILRHSLDDFKICNKIKNLFPNNENVLLLSDNYYPFELENILLQAKYVISSRYHGLIHAFKNNIPCLAIGWANKYQDLMESLSLGEYCFYYKDSIDNELIIKRIEQLEENYDKIKKTLSEKVLEIQSKNLFAEYELVQNPV